MQGARVVSLLHQPARAPTLLSLTTSPSKDNVTLRPSDSKVSSVGGLLGAGANGLATSPMNATASTRAPNRFVHDVRT
jgi:hypothetical protein